MSRRPQRDWFGLAAFDPGPWRRDGARFYLLEEVGSTSDFLLGRGAPAEGRLCRWDGWGWLAGERSKLAPPRHPRPTACAVARVQRAGRGRQGRRWRTAGLALSWLVAPLPAARAAPLAVWTGLMAAEALAELTGLPLRVKWPNDLLLAERKVGGVLLDRTVTGADVRLVAGLGLNIDRLPDDLPDADRARAAALPAAALGEPPLAVAAGAILRRWDAELPRFLAKGWAPFRARWRARDALAGHAVVVHTGEGELSGTADGIDDGGALRLRLPDGRRRTLCAGDVHLGGTPVSGATGRNR